MELLRDDEFFELRLFAIRGLDYSRTKFYDFSPLCITVRIYIRQATLIDAFMST